MSDQEIEASGILSVMEKMLKYSRDKNTDLYDVLLYETHRLGEQIKKILSDPTSFGPDYWICLYLYITEFIDQKKHNSLEVATLLAKASNKKISEFMSIAEQLRQEGRQEGRQSRNIELAKCMLLELNMPIDQVQRITELSIQELKNILES